MRVRLTSQPMPKPQRPSFFLVLQAENDNDKMDLEKIVKESMNGSNFNSGTQLTDATGRIVSLTILISRPNIP